jgi:hypothetical protein
LLFNVRITAIIGRTLIIESGIVESDVGWADRATGPIAFAFRDELFGQAKFCT